MELKPRVKAIAFDFLLGLLRCFLTNWLMVDTGQHFSSLRQSGQDMEEGAYQGLHKLPEEEDKDDNEHEAISLEEVPISIELLWEDGEEESRTVERRHRHKVKDHEE